MNGEVYGIMGDRGWCKRHWDVTQKKNALYSVKSVNKSQASSGKERYP